MSTTLREIFVTDLNDVTVIHIASFPNSALTKLGQEAVRRYYEWQMTGPHDAIAIGAYDNKDLLGFCFGGVYRGALGGFLELNRGFLIRSIIMRPWLLSDPLFRQRTRYGIGHAYRKAKGLLRGHVSTQLKGEKTPAFGILSIAVMPRVQGGGTAKLLMDFIEEIAGARGFTRMGLNVHPSNGRAVRFYEKLGWQRDRTAGIWNGHMSKTIGQISSSEYFLDEAR